MNKKSIVKNYIYNVIYEVLSIIIPIITTPYLSRVLGAEKTGIYSYTISIITYFILFGSLGVAMYGKREIAFNQINEEKRSKIFFEILLLRFITLSISMVIFYFIFCLQGEYRSYYAILLLEIVANIIDISWFFHGLEEFKRTVTRNIIIKLISTVSIFIFIKTKDDLWNYFLIYVLSALLGNLSLWLSLSKFIKKPHFRTLNIKRHLMPTIVLFIPQIATQIYTVLDKVMIGTIVSNKAEVGFYEQAQKMIKLFLTIATSFGVVMMPRVAATFAEGNNNKIKKYMNISFSFVMFLAFPLMFGVMSIAYQFVPIFYGEGYAKVAPLLCIISPIIVLIGLSNVIGTQYLLPTKQQNKYTTSVVIGALINFILNIILIGKYASIGGAIATVIAELCVTSIQFYLIKNELKIKEIFLRVYKYIIASIIMFAFNKLVIGQILSGIVSIIIQIIMSSIIYILLLLIMKDKMVIEVISIFKNKTLNYREKKK